MQNKWTVGMIGLSHFNRASVINHLLYKPLFVHNSLILPSKAAMYTSYCPHVLSCPRTDNHMLNLFSWHLDHFHRPLSRSVNLFLNCSQLVHGWVIACNYEFISQQYCMFTCLMVLKNLLNPFLTSIMTGSIYAVEFDACDMCKHGVSSKTTDSLSWGSIICIHCFSWAYVLDSWTELETAFKQ